MGTLRDPQDTTERAVVSDLAASRSARVSLVRLDHGGPVWVSLSWGENVLATRVFSDSVSLGDSPGVDIFLPQELLGRAMPWLIENTARGKTLHIPERAEHHEHDGEHRLTLGEFVLRIQPISPLSAAQYSRWYWLESWQRIAALMLAAIAHLALLAFARHESDHARQVGDVSEREEHRALMMRYLLDAYLEETETRTSDEWLWFPLRHHEASIDVSKGHWVYQGSAAEPRSRFGIRASAEAELARWADPLLSLLPTEHFEETQARQAIKPQVFEPHISVTSIRTLAKWVAPTHDNPHPKRTPPPIDPPTLAELRAFAAERIPALRLCVNRLLFSYPWSDGTVSISLALGAPSTVSAVEASVPHKCCYSSPSKAEKTELEHCVESVLRGPETSRLVGTGDWRVVYEFTGAESAVRLFPL